VFQRRGVKLADASRSTRERLRQEAAYAWDSKPVSTARVAAELWSVIKDEDWSLVSNYYSEAGRGLAAFGISISRITGRGMPAVEASVTERRHPSVRLLRTKNTDDFR
jgi:hypothetical protein